jgi:uncharacterized membrane protein
VVALAYLFVFLLSAIPLLEVKGGLALAASLNLSLPLAAVLAFLSTTIVTILLVNLFVPVLEYLKKTKLFKKFALKLEAKIAKQKEKFEARFAKKQEKKNAKLELKQEALNLQISNQNEDERKIKKSKHKKLIKKNYKLKKKLVIDKHKRNEFLKLMAVFAFVITPLPGSGVYGGSLLAAVLKLDKKKAICLLIVANAICTIIASLVVGGIIKFAF